MPQVFLGTSILYFEMSLNCYLCELLMFRSLKKDKKHFIDNLSCNVVRVKSIDVSEPLRSFVPEMVISAPILNPKPGLEPQPPVPTSASHRRSTASSYLSCLAESDLISMRDDVDGIEVESSHGSTTFNNVDVQINTDNSAVRMWLIEHGSQEHGKCVLVLCSGGNKGGPNCITCVLCTHEDTEPCSCTLCCKSCPKFGLLGLGNSTCNEVCEVFKFATS